MTYELYIGNRMYSSWSMRGWLMLDKFELPYRSHLVGLYAGTLANDLAALAPARTVPAMTTPEGYVVTDSLAMGETLAERHPQKNLYPADGAARALARSMVAEMHSGFSPLRSECSMLLSHAWEAFVPSGGVLADVERISTLWRLARETYGAKGPWLFGEYTLADVFYAPVAARFATYQLPTDEMSRAYVDSHLADPSFRRWRAMAHAEDPVDDPYPQNLAKLQWPYESSMVGDLTTNQNAENPVCPYSGLPVASFLEIEGRIFGFCNDFCRDKTMFDPAAWPAFMKLWDR